ncbi:protein ESMERALDA 1-like isoform X2 [Panicum virgatum]|uniref:protein ESMERALDA 1-like isoform X2 n=1 Tax=Panicum virgatum TaxID=38727 RepID=UPI0019D5E6F0|nr:protein ESMERALDA 1-like isoform X2 [Panicum virgatum]
MSPAAGLLNRVLPKLIEERLVRISPFANQLSFDAPPAVRRLRCLANFEALKFSKLITTISNTLVSRMRGKSAGNNGKYVAVHLRFEEDMVAFSCCIFDGGDNEKKQLDVAREKGWRGKFTRPGRVIRPGAIRMNGECPLTPLKGAVKGELCRLQDPEGKPPGVMGWWPSRSDTFVENHDTGSTQGHWPFPSDHIRKVAISERINITVSRTEEFGGAQWTPFRICLGRIYKGKQKDISTSMLS